MKKLHVISWLVTIFLNVHCYSQGTVTISTDGVQYGNVDLDIIYVSPAKDEATAMIIPCFSYVNKTTGASGYRANSLAPSKLMLIQFGCNPSYLPLAGYATYNIISAGKQYLKIRYSKHSVEGTPIVISMNGVSYSFNPANQSSWEIFTTSPWFEFNFPEPVLSVAPSLRTVNSVSGTTTFTVTSNTDWSPVENSDWLTVTKTNATTLTVTYTQNTSVATRTTNITLSGTGVSSQVVTVTQSGVTPSLSVSPSSRSVNSTSGTTSFTVASNIDWSPDENSDWLTVTKTNATTLTVTYTQNTSVATRTANITLSGTGVSSQVVTVTQSGVTPSLSVSPSSRSVNSTSGTTSFTVASNIDWSPGENSDWLTATKTNATTLTVNYTQNTSVESRSANITISGTGVTSQVVTVAQSGVTPSLSVSPSSRSVSFASGTTTFTVTSNIDWSPGENSGWLTATKTNATTLTVNYTQNTSVESRSANITISGTGVTSQVVTVTQSGVTPSLSVNPSSRSVNFASGTTTFTITSNIDWSPGENSDWLTATKTNATTLTVNYTQNTSVRDEIS